MVPSRMMKQAERYTGKFWLEIDWRWWRGPRVHVVLEIMEGWGSDVPPMPGRKKVLDWRQTSRRATDRELGMLTWANLPRFKFAPERGRLESGDPQ